MARALLLALCAAALWSAPEAPAAAAQQQKDEGRALHGQPWAFGQSEDRKEAIWRRGVPAQSLKQRAVAGAAPAAKAKGRKGAAGKGAPGTASAPRAAAGKGGQAAGAGQAGLSKMSPPNAAPRKDAVDTGNSIESALAAARAAARSGAQGAQSGGDGPAAGQAAKPKGSLGLSMKDTTTTWNVTPMREAMRPDEVLVRDRRHVVRAFAGVEPTDDLSISVGPELILKDKQHGAESAGASQPDSALGLGMQFKLDF